MVVLHGGRGEGGCHEPEATWTRVPYAVGVAFEQQLARCQAARQDARGGIAELGRRRASSGERACRGVSQRQRRRVVRRAQSRAGGESGAPRTGLGSQEARARARAMAGCLVAQRGVRSRSRVRRYRRGRVGRDTDEAAGAGQASRCWRGTGPGPGPGAPQVANGREAQRCRSRSSQP